MAVLDKPKTEVVTDEAAEAMRPWQVLVLNDPVNLMSYVVMVFRRVFGYDTEKARKHMLEVHEQGRSILWQGERETAENYVYQLQEWHLNARLVRQSDG